MLIKNLPRILPGPLDVPSVILSAFAFGGLVYSLSSISAVFGDDEFARNATVVTGVVGLLSLVLFIVRQVRLVKSGRELLNLQPFTVANFTIPIIVVALVFGTLLGQVTVFPIYLQVSVGVSALSTGLMLMPGTLLNGMLSPFIGRIYDAVGPRPLLWPGIVIAVTALFFMRQLDENSTVAQFITLHILFSISLALMLSSLMTTALGSLPPTLYGHGSAIVNTIQQLAGAAGTALLVVSLTLGAQLSAEAGAPEEMATADGTQSAMTVALIMGLIALVFSLFVKPVPKYSQ